MTSILEQTFKTMATAALRSSVGSSTERPEGEETSVGDESFAEAACSADAPK